MSRAIARPLSTRSGRLAVGLLACTWVVQRGSPSVHWGRQVSNLHGDWGRYQPTFPVDAGYQLRTRPSGL